MKKDYASPLMEVTHVDLGMAILQDPSLPLPAPPGGGGAPERKDPAF